MTRFARAKGSKSSNERVPEDATSWTELKKQLDTKLKQDEDRKKAKAFEEERSKNYKEFLKEKEDEEFKQTKWADFSDLPGNNTNITLKSKQLQKHKAEVSDDNKPAKKLKLMKANGINMKTKSSKSVKTVAEETAELNGESIKKKKQKKGSPVKSAIIESVADSVKQNGEPIKKKKQKKCLLLKKTISEAVVDETTEQNSALRTKKKTKKILPPMKPISEMNEKELLNLEKKKQRRKRQAEKRKQKTSQNTSKESTEESAIRIKKDLSETAVKKIEKKKEKKIKQVEKRKQFKEVKENDSIEQNCKENSLNKKPFLKMDNTQSKFGSNRITKMGKIAKPKLNKEHKRRKPVDGVNKVMINGDEIELKHFDGYPIKREDYDRLVKLKMEMISKGIPRSEVNKTLKLERRKAEKALSREKKNVCFNCRKSGHMLSECPNLNKDVSGTGICFKCGSTEHTHFECKVVRNQEFKFATCFICKEQGHISRQCPDNARGLYPKGGACNLCGDVTHLKKDCPKFQREQESNNIYAEKINRDNIEALDDECHTKVDVKKTLPNKIIKF